MKGLTKYGLPLVILYVIPLIISNLAGFRLGGLVMGIITCLTAVYYFNLENPHSSNKKIISVLALGWFTSIALSREYHIGTLLPAVMAGLLAYFYFLRWRARTDRHPIDVLKLIGIVLLVPATYFETGVVVFICFYLGSIFLLDRLIIRNHMNKTAQIITFSVMVLICITLLVYSFIKADEAAKAALAAKIAQDDAIEQAKRADIEAEKAVDAAAMAKMNEAEALRWQKELEECKNNK